MQVNFSLVIRIMKKIAPIIIAVLALLTGGTYIALNVGDEVTVPDIQQVDFEQVQIQIKDLEMATSTDEFGKTVNIGVRIPIKYNFPVATTTGYIIEEREEYVEMNFGAYNMCRRLGDTVEKCGQELKADMISNVETRKINLERELEEFKAKVFWEEIVIENL